MKKLIASLLVLVMILSLAACEKTPGDADTSSDRQETASQDSKETSKGNADQTAEAADSVYEVSMIMPYILTPPGQEAVQQTEDTINNYMRDTLGITDYKLDLKVWSISDVINNVPMELAAKSKLDIISIWGGIGPYVENGTIIPLDDYLDNEMKEAHEKVKDFMICEYLNGHYFAIPSWSAQVIDYRFIYNKDMVDAVCDMSDVDTWDEVLDALEKLKEAYPDEHFLCYPSTFPDIYAMEDHTSIVGNYTATVGDSTTLVNYYSTDAYRKACEKAYELRQKGMLDPEGSANTLGHDALTYSGSTKGVLMGHSLTESSVVKMFDNNNTYGATFDCVTFGRTDMVNARFTWAIPYTSENPSAAAKMINLIWTDEFIFNTLGFGTEGIDYVWNEDHSMLLYPEGLGQMTVPYNCIYELAGMGDQRMTWPADGGTLAEDLAFLEEEMENCYYPPMFGFTPTTDNVTTQLAAVSNVVSQYNTALVYGEENPDELLPEFLEVLETAGINDIISDYQAQYDLWAASN